MIYISNELSHHGVKGMKWGVRNDQYSGISGRMRFRKDFKKDQRRIHDRNMEAGWKKFDKKGYRSKLDAMDAAEKKKHSGYEDGDLYTPDWRSIKKTDKTSKKVKEYSRMTDALYDDDGGSSVEQKAYSYASKKTKSDLTEKYGSDNVKKAYKLYKSKKISELKNNEQVNLGKKVVNN